MRTRDHSSPSHAALRGDTREEDSVQGGLCAGPALHWPRSLWRDSDPSLAETGGATSVWGPGRQAVAVWVGIGPLPWLMEASSGSQKGALPPRPEPPCPHPRKHLKPLCFLTATGQPLDTRAPGAPGGLRWAVGRLCLQSTGNGPGRWEQALWGGPSRGVIRAGCHCHLSSVGASPSGGVVVPKVMLRADVWPEPPGTTHSIFGEKKLQAPSPEPSPPCLEALPTLRAALKAPMPWSPRT